jgi:hypothetical protein
LASSCGSAPSDYSPTATIAPSLRPVRPEQFPYKVPVSAGYHHYPKVFLFILALALLVMLIGSSFWRGPMPAQGPIPDFPQSTGNPYCSLHGLQPEGLPVDLTGCRLSSKL